MPCRSPRAPVILSTILDQGDGSSGFKIGPAGYLKDHFEKYLKYRALEILLL
ncbi:MAG: hypothetical protein PHP51_05480 [Desulfotomaculaceae bacterium]|nr:hypothetical protein [Desulfotomaculaceae bacterium]